MKIEHKNLNAALLKTLLLISLTPALCSNTFTLRAWRWDRWQPVEGLGSGAGEAVRVMRKRVDVPWK